MLNKKIIIIIGGGIAAYKSLDLIRILKKKGCEIKVVLTESGKKFVTPLSIASLSQNKVYENIFDIENEAEMDHISLSRWCDIILFVPITANSIAKLALGKADDLASNLICKLKYNYCFYKKQWLLWRVLLEILILMPTYGIYQDQYWRIG